MNKVGITKVLHKKESARPSQAAALFSLDQVDNSVQLLVACGDILSPAVRAKHRQWLDIRARALIAAKLSTIYENQLGKSNTSYGKAKLWAELAARWVISGNDTVAHMYRARNTILQMLRAHPPSAETVLKTFQTIYNHARKNVRKGNVPIDKLAPYVRQLPVRQNQVTVQALKFASASAHAIKWSDYLVLTDDAKRQLDIIKNMPNLVIIFNKLKLQLREDWQEQWKNAESNQILAFYEMINKAHPVEQSNRYIEALVGVSYSICKGPNIIDKWLDFHLRKIQKKFPDIKIKDCVSIEDINTFISGYIKSEISIDDIYKFLKYIYSSLNKGIKKAVNLVIEQAIVKNYSHAIAIGAFNMNTKYKSLPYLINNLPRVQWTKIAQIAVDLQRDPWHAIVKAQTTVREFIDLANFGKVGMSIIREKFKTNFEGFIHGGILSKEEILELVERARVLAVKELEEVVSLDGLSVAPMLANINIVFIENRIFTCNSKNDIGMQQDEGDVVLELQSEALEDMGVRVEEQEEVLKQQNDATNSAIILESEEDEIQLEQQNKATNSAIILESEEDEIQLEQQNDATNSAIILESEEDEIQLEQQNDAINSKDKIPIEDPKEDTEQYNINSKMSLQQEELEALEELVENREKFSLQQQDDIQQRNINALISLQQEIQVAQQYEQKDVLEQFYKQQDEVLLQRYRKIANSWQHEVQTTQQDELNDVLEQFQKQLEEDIQQCSVNNADSLPQQIQEAQQDEINDSLKEYIQNRNTDIQQLNINGAISLLQEVQIAEEDKLNNGLEKISMYQEEQEEELQTISSTYSLQKHVQIIEQDELIDDLEEFSEQQEQDIYRYNSNSAISSEQEDQTAQQEELIDSLEEIGKYLKEQEEHIMQLDCSNAITSLQEDSIAKQDELLNDAVEPCNKQKEEVIEQYNTNTIIILQQEVLTASRDEQRDVLEEFNDKNENLQDIPQINKNKVSVAESAPYDDIVLGQGNLPKAAKKFPDIGTEISQAQLPKLYARAVAIHEDIKAARVICKYLNIIGRRSIFHPFVKGDRRRSMPSRFRPIPVELRNAAAVFGVKMPDDPIDDSLNEDNAKELTKAPRPVIKEISSELEVERGEEKNELTL